MIGPLVPVSAAFLGLLVHTVAWADDAARVWLEQMSAASQSLNYSGVFVYQHEDRLDAMRIVHAMDENGERERLLSLTGPQREVLRDNQVVTCILGDLQSVHVNKSRPRAPFPISFPKELMQLENYYSFEVLGDDRVAGLNCRVVAVKSRDAFRYGRRLCVHEDSHLLLRSEVIGEQGRAVERMMFTSVTFPGRISSQELAPNVADAGFTWKREPEQPPAAAAAADSRWEISRVPDGFMLIDYGWRRLSDREPGVEHWVYSDGLASLSIYVEKSQDDSQPYSGITHRGALNAFGSMVDGHYVTVIGEVPRSTVEMVGTAVRSR